MTRRAKIHLIGLPLMPILILASTGSKCANAQATFRLGAMAGAWNLDSCPLISTIGASFK